MSQRNRKRTQMVIVQDQVQKGLEIIYTSALTLRGEIQEARVWAVIPAGIIFEQKKRWLMHQEFGAEAPKHQSGLCQLRLQDVVNAVDLDPLMSNTRRAMSLFFLTTFPICAPRLRQPLGIGLGRVLSTRNRMM